MASKKFWVIGGEYTDSGFDSLVQGTEQMFGPYASRDDALQVWRRVADETRSLCMARFTVVGEGSQA
jgi:hypothetical protein